MRQLRHTILYLTVFLFISHVCAFEKQRIVFYYVKGGPGISNGDILRFKHALENSLHDNPKFDLVDIGQIQLVFKRNHIPEDGCTTTACAIKIGKDPDIGASYAMYAELYLNEEGLYVANVKVVDIYAEKLSWQPSELIQVKSKNDFLVATTAIVDEFSKTIAVEPRVSSVRDSFVTIDAGFNLGIRRNNKYYVLFDEQLDDWHTSIDTTGIVKIINVNKKFSLARILSQDKPIIPFSRLVPIQKKGDLIPPIINHLPVHKCSKFLDLHIKAEISDNKKVDHANLMYSFTPSGPTKTVPFQKKKKQKNHFVATISKFVINNQSHVYYYIEAFDNSGNKRIYRDINNKPFKINVIMDDRTPPNISFKKPKQRPKTQDLFFSVNVTDNIAVKRVSIFYKYNSRSYQRIDLKPFSENNYGVSIQVSKLKTSIIWYYIQAEDNSGNKNFVAGPSDPEQVRLINKDIQAPQISRLFNLKRQEKNTFLLALKVKDDSDLKEATIQATFFRGYKEIAKKKFKAHKVSKNVYEFILHINENIYTKVGYFVKLCDFSGNCISSPTHIINLENYVVREDKSPPEFGLFIPLNIALKPINHKRKGDLFYPFIIRVRDNVGLSEVMVFSRTIGSMDKFKKSKAHRMVGGNKYKYEYYAALLKASGKGIEYYLKAVDSNGLITIQNNSGNFFKDDISYNPNKIGKLPSSMNH